MVLISRVDVLAEFFHQRGKTNCILGSLRLHELVCYPAWPLPIVLTRLRSYGRLQPANGAIQETLFLSIFYRVLTSRLGSLVLATSLP